MFWIFIKIFIHHGHAYFTKKITYFLKLTRCTLPIREYPTQVVHKVHAFCLDVVNTPFGLQVHQFCTMYVSSPFICKRVFFSFRKIHVHCYLTMFVSNILRHHICGCIFPLAFYLLSLVKSDVDAGARAKLGILLVEWLFLINQICQPD